MLVSSKAGIVTLMSGSTVAAIGQRIEHSVTCISPWLDQVGKVAHWNTTPFGDPGPSMNTEMRGDLLLLWHFFQLGAGELSRMLHQPVYS